MASEITRAFYNTTAWKNCRREYKKSVGGLCERCLKRGIYTPAFIVHHKIKLTADNINDPRIALSWDNLEAVCKPCHEEIHEADKTPRKRGRYTVDEYGRVYIPPISK